MTEIQNSNKYNLEDRTFRFAKECRTLISQLPKTMGNFEDGKQLIRSSGSIHANYIEANESLSRKDYYHRVKICRKETKESRFWLLLIDIQNNTFLNEKRNHLIGEANELMRIFGSIVETEKKN